MIKNTQDHHLPWLDGLRGMAALWVVLSHVQILSGLQSIPVLSWGGLAVDLFMILSGFLMAHHYSLRNDKEPWNSLTTAYKFWIRRFFRIAPLYYYLLIIAMLLGPWLGGFRLAVAEHWPSTATPIERYIDQSFKNFALHFSFVFGAIPAYAFRTPLPDWSIGLEMQFYLLFPLIMAFVFLAGPVLSSIVIFCLCLILQYLSHDFFGLFGMPSFLPIKLYVFLVGILISVGRQRGAMASTLFVSLAMVLVSFVFDSPVISFVRLVMVVCLFYLMDNGSLPCGRWVQFFVDRLRYIFSTKLAVFLGNTSYAVYLLHLLVLLPIAGALVSRSWYLEFSGGVRASICFFLTSVIVYPFAWFLYELIEKRGISYGKNVLRRMAI